MRKRTLVAVVVGPMIMALATGCGPTMRMAGDTTAAHPALNLTANDAPRVEVDTYATALCSGLANFGLSYSEAKTARAAASKGSAVRARAAMLGYIDALDAALTRAIGDIQQAGVPDLADGARISTDLLGALQNAQQANQDLRAKVAALPSSDRSAFDAASGPLLDRSDRDVGTALQKLTKLDDEPGFQAAFNHNRICRAL
ncbi:MAG TPA: hypothetical protein VE081_03745 [Sporichthyaceae bacterium]|nr:hypothetical protein [Sporichthyaceae bacterium]